MRIGKRYFIEGIEGLLENEKITRRLGKLSLYQLSYARLNE